VLAHLREYGASFFAEVVRGANAHPRDVLEALWQLAWDGRVTNDTFTALRALGWPRKANGGSPRGRGSLVPPEAAGRWSLTRPISDDGPAATSRAYALATTLLERYGVVTRETVANENVPGGFSAVYPVLKAMEESGRVRRGYFIEGLGGAQFALPGAVERLRAERDAPDEPKVLLLAATDPANPYGATLPGPRRDDTDRRPLARAAGARAVLVDGEPVLYLERGGRAVVTLPAFDDDENATLALAALTADADTATKPLIIERIDGADAATSPVLAHFADAGFVPGYRGLTYRKVVEKRLASAGRR
jgi:ATP-dependent Lhr-like helicase